VLLVVERNDTARTLLIDAEADSTKTGSGVEIAALDKLCWNWQTRQSSNLTGLPVDDLVASLAARELVVVEAVAGWEILGARPPC